MKRGFTLIEVLIAMSIILILIGIGVMGWNSMSNQQRTKSTGVALQNAASVVAELEATAGLNRLPVRRAIEAPAVVTEGSPDQYTDAHRFTRENIRAMRAVPANRSAMDQLPTSAVGVPNYSGAVSYKPGDQVTGPDGKVYIAETSPSSAPPSGGWRAAESSEIVPFFLDAWGNPLLFVPPPNLNSSPPLDWEERYGLRDLVVADRGTTKHRMLNPGGIEQDEDATTNTIYPPGGQLDRLRHFRSFWVSAGPDGNFQTHDDNIYSFDD